MSELTLTNKFSALTGINGFDIDAYITAASNKTKAYNELQWKIAKGLMRDPKLYKGADKESHAYKTLILYGEVMLELANKCGIEITEDTNMENFEIDINSNQTTTDAEDLRAKEILSEAYSIMYDSEDDETGSSSN